MLYLPSPGGASVVDAGGEISYFGSLGINKMPSSRHFFKEFCFYATYRITSLLVNINKSL